MVSFIAIFHFPGVRGIWSPGSGEAEPFASSRQTAVPKGHLFPFSSQREATYVASNTICAEYRAQSVIHRISFNPHKVSKNVIYH